MIDKTPTQEQIKEFWEWCGWKWIKKRHIVNQDSLDEHFENGYWRDPNGGRWATDKKPDLNNLFKYAVPKFWVYMARGVMGYWVVEVRQYDDIGTNHKRGFAEGYNIELALFWAIWEVIHG